MPGCGCGGTACYDAKFDVRVAEDDLARYRRRGPDRTTRLLVGLLTAQGVDGAMLLDVGGGIGAVQHGLLEAGAGAAVEVEASAPYLRAARAEAERRGYGGRTSYLHGDFVAMAPEIEPADVVTLDRVICCYSDLEGLVAASGGKARRLYGIVVPRDAWWVRAGDRAANLLRRLAGSGFRTYVHRLAAIDAAASRQGLTRRATARTPVWEVAVYGR